MITVVCEDNKEDDKNIQGKKCFIKLTKTSYKKKQASICVDKYTKCVGLKRFVCMYSVKMHTLFILGRHQC